MKDDELCHLINEQSTALIIILSYVLKHSLSPAMLFVWKAASLITNMTPPLPILPISIVFPAAGVLLPSTWHRTLLGRPGKEQLQASALQSSVSACTLFSSVLCLMSHASHVRCWARCVWQAVNPCTIHTGDTKLKTLSPFGILPTHTFTLRTVKLKALSGLFST